MINRIYLSQRHEIKLKPSDYATLVIDRPNIIS